MKSKVINTLTAYRVTLQKYCHKDDCKERPFFCPRDCNCGAELDLDTSIAWEVSCYIALFITDTITAETLLSTVGTCCSILSRHKLKYQKLFITLVLLEDYLQKMSGIKLPVWQFQMAVE